MMLDQKDISLLTRFSLIAVLCFFTFEIVNDILEGESLLHHLTETFFFLLAFITMVVHVRDAHNAKRELAEIAQKENSSTAKPSEKIQQQLEMWKLTPSEKEISWLILKGFSFAEIAYLRSVKEKTVRAQATAIYQKSETNNRNDFAARFIDELLNSQ